MDERQINKMHSTLMALDVAKNTVSVSEFGRFIPLFRKDHTLNEEELKDLANSFIRRFNPYENIQVIDPDDNVIVTLPRIFTKVKAIDTKLTPIVNRFSRDAGSDIPKYAAEATKGLMAAIDHTHTHDTEYQAYIAKISEDYARLQDEFTEMVGVASAQDEKDETVVSNPTDKGDDGTFAWK